MLRYFILIDDMKINLNFIISPIPITNDFSFNLLMYDGIKLECQPLTNYNNGSTYNFNNLNVEDIINQINSKQGFALPKYEQLNFTTSNSQNFAHRFQNILYERKYKLINKDAVINHLNINSIYYSAQFLIRLIEITHKTCHKKTYK